MIQSCTGSCIHAAWLSSNDNISYSSHIMVTASLLMLTWSIDFQQWVPLHATQLHTVHQQWLVSVGGIHRAKLYPIHNLFFFPPSNFIFVTQTFSQETSCLWGGKHSFKWKIFSSLRYAIIIKEIADSTLIQRRKDEKACRSLGDIWLNKCKEIVTCFCNILRTEHAWPAVTISLFSSKMTGIYIC